MADLNQVNADNISSIISEQTNLLAESSSILTGILSNVYGFLSEISALGERITAEKKENAMDYETMLGLSRKLFDYIEQVHIEIPALTDSMKETDDELKRHQQQIRAMTIELEKSNSLILDSKQKETSLKNEAVLQSNFSAAMGSIMGTMLWKTSKTEEVINTFINEGMILDFVIMSNVTLNSFTDSYPAELPPLDSHEYKFLMSVLGTSINISAQRSGREFLLANDNGLTYTKNILDFLGFTKMPAGRLLKRMSLIFLFNLSICKRGAMFIQLSEKGIESILSCLGSEYTSEIQSIVLTLMKSLLDEIPTRDFCQQVIKLTSREDLQRLMEQDDDDLKYLCTKFHNKIRELEAPMEF